MLDRLQNYFSDRMAPTSDQDDDHRLRVATCALLLEAAHADQDFSDEEARTVAGMVGERFELGADETRQLLELAEAERREATDLYQFARLIDQGFPRPRKLAVVELLWRVVYSDGVLEAHEDALMKKIGTLLGLRHEELMALKVKVLRERE